MIRAERRALLRADASALRDADREVVRTRSRADRMSDSGGIVLQNYFRDQIGQY